MNVDRRSETWLAIESWAKARAADYRRRLEIIGLPSDETEGLRHSIREMDALLNVGNPSKMAAAQLQVTKHLEP